MNHRDRSSDDPGAVQPNPMGLQTLRKAVEATPENGVAWSLYGRELAKAGDLDEAETALMRALALAPDRSTVLANLGAVALRKGDPARADALLSDLLDRHPDHADAQYNRGLARLTLGRWAEGFSDYRARWRAWGLERPFPDSPTWMGQPLREGPLLVSTEQGMGDAIHFLRFLPPARQRAGAVLLACRPAMGRLLCGAPGLDGLIPLGIAPPPHAATLPLMDLPGVLGLGPQDGAPVPYLLAETERAVSWAARLETLAPDCEGLRVGIAWRGSPTHGLDRERSIPLSLFAPLARVPGVTLVALHPDVTSEEAALCDSLGILTPDPDPDWRTEAFVGTAGLMAVLDLILSVDTVFAHLAGALGRPVRVLLPRMADWRWGLADKGTPWYPTMTLVRQGPDGLWPPVLVQEERHMARRIERRLKKGNLGP
ncbi:tetratricopeptide repeat protein [Rhodospirillum sp. A1_3_36]|uniref:tetratricopeptide repeat protein n=1 Tax=Rhodospirillum sp. A1_3_36 TaxID=3391666 RepID=UPI0039A707C8